MSYTIEEHKHRLAAWAASRAASANEQCRFKVRVGVAILEASGFDSSFSRVDQLPKPADVVNTHRIWRESVIREAKARNLKFTHGVAAKLINCYLKVRFVCGGHENHEHVKCLPPPIDRTLLSKLAAENVSGLRANWKAARDKGWSKFDSAKYEEVIDLIRQSLPADEPLWKIEEHWEGHQ